MSAAQSNKEGAIVLNTEQCRELNRVRAKTIRTMPLHRRVRVLEKKLKCSKKEMTQTTTELHVSRYDVKQCKEIRMISSGDQQARREIKRVLRV